MIAAILRAQILSMRVRRGSRRGGLVFSLITALVFNGIFGLIGWGEIVFFSQPDRAGSFLPVLSGGLFAVMLYWQLAPVIAASFGASLDLRKLIAYPIPHRTLFLVEILLRVTTCVEMPIVVGAASIGLVRNPLYGWAASPAILAAALCFCATNILLSAGTRNLLERVFQRTRMREIMMLVVVVVSVTPQIMLYAKVKKSTLLHAAPSQLVWPWAAPAHLMLRDTPWLSFAIVLGWLGVAWYFSLWQFERGIRYDRTGPKVVERQAGKERTGANSVFDFPSRFLKDPIAALVEKELRTLTRIPRFRLVYLMSCFFGLAMYLPTLRRTGGPSVFMVQAGLPLMSLYGLLMLGQISYWNSLGFERSAVQGYFSWPLRFRDVLIAKNITVLCLLFPLILLNSLAIRIVHIPAGPGKILETLIVMFVASLYWLALGNIFSVRMPRPLDPAKMNQMTNKLQALTIFAAPFVLLPLALAYWCRWFFESQMVFAGIVLVSAIIGGIFYWVGLDSASQSASLRREAIITELSSAEGPLSVT